MSNNEDKLEKIEVLSRLRYNKINLTERMKQAFLNVPREEFVLEKHRNRAYVDTPLPILSNQTISAIHMVMIYVSPSCTNPQIGDKVLEVGAGSGYHAAIFAEMVAPKGCDSPGHVYAIEIVPELVKFARENIEKAGYSNRVTIIGGDGGIGYPEQAPYDIVSVAAAGKRIPPPLLDQVAIGGTIVLPIGKNYYQELILMTKEKDGSFSERNLGGVAFVPLTGKYG